MMRTRHFRTWSVLLLAACAEQECQIDLTDPSIYDYSSPPVLKISPANTRVLLSDTAKLDAVSGGGGWFGEEVLDPAVVTWSSGSPSVVHVVRPGIVVAAGVGSAVITATWPATPERQTLTATATIEVLPQSALRSMVVVPQRDTLVPDETLEYGVRAHDASGREIALWPRWSSSNETIATVTARGVATGGQPGEASIVATAVTGQIAEAPVTVVAPRQFTSLAGGLAFTCGIDTNAAAYCWGDNAIGQLGAPSIAAGNHSRPVAVSGGHAFATITAGSGHACGLTTDGRILCWGLNFRGQLGDGTTLSRAAPAEISGGRRFTSVEAGWYHTCGVEAAGEVYCWGSADWGQLGRGIADTVAHPIPERVQSTLAFGAITGGAEHTCGLTITGTAYCWGKNDRRQVGVDSDGGACARSEIPLCFIFPTAVVGDRTFATITAGATHTCGLTTAGEAYCWGSNIGGQLGVPQLACQGAPWCATPLAVRGGFRYGTLDAGNAHTCAVTTDGIAYCWGNNDYRQLGVPSASFTQNFYEPVRVSGDKRFTRVATGGMHSCAVAVGGAAYCWGANTTRQLGSRVWPTSASPVPVRR